MRIRWFRSTIAGKVAQLTGVMTALASMIVGYIIYQGGADILYQNALNSLKYETNIKSIYLVADIENLSQDVHYLSGTPPILGIPRSLSAGGVDPLDNSSIDLWEDRLATIFTEIIKAKPSYLQIRYIGVKDNGREIVRVDRQGSHIYRTPKLKLQKKGETGYFKQAIAVNKGDIYISDITLSREFGKVVKPHTPVMRIAKPIYFDDELFGIIIINKGFDDILHEFVINTPRDLLPFVTNEQGYYLAHPDKEYTFGFDLDTNHKIQNDYPSFDFHHSRDIRDDEHTFDITGNVIHVVKAYFDPQNKNRFLGVILATSRDHMLEESRVLRNISFVAMLVLVISSSILTTILVKRLLSPLRLISKASEDMALGKNVTGLPLSDTGEIGELARSFDNMRQQLDDKKQELLKSQAHAHQSSKLTSLGEMASGMAHEINSPIQTISLIAQRIKRSIENNKKTDVPRAMDKITDNAKKVSDIIESLRKVSRDSHNDAFSYVMINDILKDVVNIMEEQFKVNNIDFSIHYDGINENHAIRCQHLQITQILINLINNAFYATLKVDNKWIVIDIKKHNSYVNFIVTDSGKGVADNIKEKIFEPLFTTKDIGEGTGLGLSISRDIANNHNGDVFLDASHNFTRFILKLPISESSSKNSENNIIRIDKNNNE